MTNQLIIPMSSSGHCIRALTAELLGKESKDIPHWLSTAAKEGNLHEKAIKDDLRAKGEIIEESIGECQECKKRFGTGRQGIHVEIDLGTILMIGHMDGLHRYNTDEFCPRKLECKSMSQYEFQRWMKDRFVAFPHYGDQLTCYGEATHISESLYIVKNRNNGYCDIQLLKEDPHDFQEIKSRLLYVAECVENNKLPDVDYNPESIYCNRCLFTGLCLPEPKEYSSATIELLQSALDKKAKSIELEKQATSLKYEAEQVIKDHLKAIGQNKLKFSGWSISMTPNQTVTTYPKANLLRILSEEQLKEVANVSNPFDRLYMKNLNIED